MTRPAEAPRQRRSGIYLGVAIVSSQIAWILLTYWARVQTFIVERGRIRPFETLLRSDFVVFVAPFVVSLLALAFFLASRPRLRSVATWVLAVVLAVIGEFVALSIALNVWGG